MSVLSKLFGTDTKDLVEETPPPTQDAPHVELGWSVEDVRLRYRQFDFSEVPVVRASENPLNDDDVREALRTTDMHKTMSLLYFQVPRWNLLSNLLITFNEKNMAMGIIWFLGREEPIPMHTFSTIESELKAHFGSAKKNVSRETVTWLWMGDDFEVYFSARIQPNDVKDATLAINFTGYQKMKE